MTRDDLLRANTMKRLGHVAYHLGLTEALSRPMVAILGDVTRGRMFRDLTSLAQKCGGEDLASLLAYGDDLLAATSRKPLKAKLLRLARTYLVTAVEQAQAGAEVQASKRPRTRAALRKWAADHRVEPLLEANVYRELNPSEPALFSGTVDREVENGPFEVLLGDPELSRRTSISASRLRRLQAAAWTYLQKRAQDAAAAQAEVEAAGLTNEPPADDESTRAQLIRAALKARAELAPLVVARPRADTRAEPHKLEDGQPPKFIFIEAAEDRYAFPTRVEVPLTLEGPWKLTCTAHKNPCAHRVAALDSLLDVLQNGDPNQVAAITDPVGLPAWMRGLKALDAVLGADDAPASSNQALITWGIDLSRSRPELTGEVQVPTSSGELGKPRRLKPATLLDGDQALDPDDRHIAELLELFGLMPDPRSTRAQQVLQRALQRLVGHPRVVRKPDGTPLTVRTGTLALVTLRAEGQIRLLPAIDEATLPLEAFTDRLRNRVGRLILHIDDDEHLVLVQVPPSFEEVIQTLLQHDFLLPDRALPELVQRLPSFSRRVPVLLDRDVPRRTEPARRHLVLRLGPRGRGLTVQAGVMPLAGGPVHLPGEGPAEVLSVDPDGRLRATLRDRPAEAAWARERVNALMPIAEPDEAPWRYAIPDPQDALRLIDGLRESKDVSVVWSGRQGWRISAAEATTKAMRIQVRDRRDWFGLEGSIDVDGHQVSLADLVDAVRRDQTFVAVGPDQWARIGADLRAHLEELEPHVRTDEEGLSVSPAATDALEALGGSGQEFVRSVRWQANLARLDRARNVDLAPPETFKAQLRSYQQEGFQWMLRLATWGLGACLADDMGLGKTVQALAVLSARAALGPQLVVAPTSLVYNWQRETGRFAPDLTPSLYVGADRTLDVDTLGPGSLLITSYGLLVRDIDRLAAITWTSLILDEAQAIKNAESQRSAAVRRLPAEWRLALSGTPIENHLGELWALFSAISPALLGRWADFRERYVVPIERDGHRARAGSLSRLIRPFVLRRTKSEVARDLPPRTTIDVDIVLSEAEREAYDGARAQAVAELSGPTDLSQARFQALAAITRLRQLACHPRLVDSTSEIPSSKLQRLLALVQQLAETDQRALVFSQFTRHLHLVRAALDEAGLSYSYLDGQTSPEERAARVERFQTGDDRLFLISLKAGGTGLTLTSADTVIHLDPWWNPAVEDQATDRAHRIGQTKPVTVYRLIARGTIEEAILQLHADKRALVGQILDGTQTAGALSTNDLIGLIQGRE